MEVAREKQKKVKAKRESYLVTSLDSEPPLHTSQQCLQKTWPLLTHVLLNSWDRKFEYPLNHSHVLWFEFQQLEKAILITPCLAPMRINE